MKIKNMIWITLGFVSLSLGALGAVLPVLPSVPFLLLAAFSFGKGSKKLHKWFIATKLYKNNLETYVKGQGMTWKTKIRIIVTVTILMAFGFMMMFSKEIYVPCIILAFVWLFHIIYFIFKVKTYQPQSEVFQGGNCES